jgi:hypothetical protein
MNTVAEPDRDSRIDQLERRVRWLMSMTTLLVLMVVALLAWQFYPRTQPIAGMGFELIDGHGKRRAELSLRDDGGPMLRLNNADERARVTLYLRSDGSAGLRLADASGVNRAELSANAEGRPELSIGGIDGRAIATFGAGPDSAGSIRLTDARHRRFWASPSGAETP